MALGVTRVREMGRLPAATLPDALADAAAELLPPAPRPEVLPRATERRAAVPAPLVPPERAAASRFDAAALMAASAGVAGVPLLLPACPVVGNLLPVPRPCAGVAAAAVDELGAAARRG